MKIIDILKLKIKRHKLSFLRTSVFIEHFQESYIDLDQGNRGIGDVRILFDSSILQIEDDPMQ